MKWQGNIFAGVAISTGAAALPIPTPDQPRPVEKQQSIVPSADDLTSIRSSTLQAAKLVDLYSALVISDLQQLDNELDRDLSEMYASHIHAYPQDSNVELPREAPALVSNSDEVFSSTLPPRRVFKASNSASAETGAVQDGEIRRGRLLGDSRVVTRGRPSTARGSRSKILRDLREPHSPARQGEYFLHELTSSKAIGGASVPDVRGGGHEADRWQPRLRDDEDRDGGLLMAELEDDLDRILAEELREKARSDVSTNFAAESWTSSIAPSSGIARRRHPIAPARSEVQRGRDGRGRGRTGNRSVKRTKERRTSAFASSRGSTLGKETKEEKWKPQLPTSRKAIQASRVHRGVVTSPLFGALRPRGSNKVMRPGESPLLPLADTETSHVGPHNSAAPSVDVRPKRGQLQQQQRQAAEHLGSLSADLLKAARLATAKAASGHLSEIRQRFSEQKEWHILNWTSTGAALSALGWVLATVALMRRHDVLASRNPRILYSLSYGLPPLVTYLHSIKNCFGQQYGNRRLRAPLHLRLLICFLGLPAGLGLFLATQTQPATAGVTLAIVALFFTTHPHQAMSGHMPKPRPVLQFVPLALFSTLLIILLPLSLLSTRSSRLTSSTNFAAFVYLSLATFFSHMAILCFRDAHSSLNANKAKPPTRRLLPILCTLSFLSLFFADQAPFTLLLHLMHSLFLNIHAHPSQPLHIHILAELLGVWVAIPCFSGGWAQITQNCGRKEDIAGEKRGARQRRSREEGKGLDSPLFGRKEEGSKRGRTYRFKGTAFENTGESKRPGETCKRAETSNKGVHVSRSVDEGVEMKLGDQEPPNFARSEGQGQRWAQEDNMGPGQVVDIVFDKEQGEYVGGNAVAAEAPAWLYEDDGEDPLIEPIEEGQI